MLVESKLAAWLAAGIAQYKATPLLVESVFYDASQSGWPTRLTSVVLEDREKAWLPQEYAGGVLRWSGATFPIVSNTSTTLVVQGDLTSVSDSPPLGYHIVPPAAAQLAQLFQTETFTISTAFAQVPTQMPAFTLRLEKDTQADTYLGESLKTVGMEGLEMDVYTQLMTGAYLLSIWTVNREATLWLYAWVLHYGLLSLGQFATWGLADVSFSGSDLDPMLQYLAERTYSRHLLLTCTRVERAIRTQAVPYVTDVCIQVCAQYAHLAATLPQPMA